MESFLILDQQKQSRLASSPAIIHMPSKGQAQHMARMGALQLVEVFGRNPDKVYSDFGVDNRRFTKSRYTATILVDRKTDINELISDPTSSIMENLLSASMRLKDKIIITNALGAVLTGAPDAAATSTSASSDGVRTVDATAGLTYAKINEITENFLNQDITRQELTGAIIAISGTEHTALMSEDEFISNDYIDGRPVGAGGLQNAGIYNIEVFGGSKTGGTTYTNPILAESGTTRNCAVLAPKSVALTVDIPVFEVQKSPTKVDSNEVHIVMEIGAMRTQGSRVQQLNTTF